MAGENVSQWACGEVRLVKWIITFTFEEETGRVGERLRRFELMSPLGIQHTFDRDDDSP